MLTTTAHGYIMGNAPESLKKKLPQLQIIDTNEFDGVAKFLAASFLDREVLKN